MPWLWTHMWCFTYRFIQNKKPHLFDRSIHQFEISSRKIGHWNVVYLIDGHHSVSYEIIKTPGCCHNNINPALQSCHLILGSTSPNNQKWSALNKSLVHSFQSSSTNKVGIISPNLRVPKILPKSFYLLKSLQGRSFENLLGQIQIQRDKSRTKVEQKLTCVANSSDGSIMIACGEFLADFLPTSPPPPPVPPPTIY